MCNKCFKINFICCTYEKYEPAGNGVILVPQLGVLFYCLRNFFIVFFPIALNFNIFWNLNNFSNNVDLLSVFNLLVHWLARTKWKLRRFEIRMEECELVITYKLCKLACIKEGKTKANKRPTFPVWAGRVGLPVIVVCFCVIGFHTALNSNARSRSCSCRREATLQYANAVIVRLGGMSLKLLSV